MSKQQIVRGVLHHCQICNKKYNLLHKQHICKRCHRSICSECTEQKQPIFQKKEEKRKPHRLCKICKPQVHFLENYHGHYQLKFNSVCKVGKQWYDKVSKVAVSHPPQYQKPKKDALKSKSDIWGSFTFSYRNFVGILIMDIDYYTALRYVYDKCSYSNCSEYVILFLLCHCDQQMALEITNNLMYSLEQYPPSRDSVYQNLEFLGCNSVEINSLKYYIEYKFTPFMKDLSLNHLTVQLSLFVISGVMSERKPRNSLEKCFSIFIFIIRDIILKNGIDFNKIELESLQTLKAQDFETNMRVLLHKEKLEEQTMRLKNQSKTLKESLNEHMRMSVDRKSSITSYTSEEIGMYRNNSNVSAEELNEILAEEPGMVRQGSSGKEKIDGGIERLFGRMESVSEEMGKDMREIQRLTKELLLCLDQ